MLQIAKFERAKSPTMEVIQAWARMGAHTIGDLISILKTDLDRPDVITDIPEFIRKYLYISLKISCHSCGSVVCVVRKIYTVIIR